MTLTMFVKALKRPRSTIRNALTTGRSVKYPVSCTICTIVLSTCAHCSSGVQVHLNPFKPLWTAHRTKIQNFPERMSLRKSHRVPPHLRDHPSSSHPSTRHHSIHRQTKNCQCENCQCDASVAVPVFLGFILLSNFSRPSRPVFVTLSLGTNLWIFFFQMSISPTFFALSIANTHGP